MPRPPDDIRRGEPITARWLNEAKNAPPVEIRGGPGILVKRVGRDLIIEATAKKPPIGGGGAAPLFARITGATQDGSNKRWVYAGRLLTKTGAGYGGWTEGPIVTVYNLIEDPNGSTGTYGNGATQDELDAAGGTFALRRIPNGVPVPVWRVGGEYWTSYENGVGGECAS